MLGVVSTYPGVLAAFQPPRQLAVARDPGLQGQRAAAPRAPQPPGPSWEERRCQRGALAAPLHAHCAWTQTTGQDCTNEFCTTPAWHCANCSPTATRAADPGHAHLVDQVGYVRRGRAALCRGRLAIHRFAGGRARPRPGGFVHPLSGGFCAPFVTIDSRGGACPRASVLSRRPRGEVLGSPCAPRGVHALK